MWRLTKERQGVGQLARPLAAGFCVQVPQPLHDVAVAHLAVAKVTLRAGAPGWGRAVRWRQR